MYFIKIPSALPLSTTFVSPVTIFTPQGLDAVLMLSNILSKSLSGNPSSIIKPQLRYRGIAPPTVRSFYGQLPDISTSEEYGINYM